MLFIQKVTPVILSNKWKIVAEVSLYHTHLSNLGTVKRGDFALQGDFAQKFRLLYISSFLTYVMNKSIVTIFLY